MPQSFINVSTFNHFYPQLYRIVFVNVLVIFPYILQKLSKNHIILSLRAINFFFRARPCVVSRFFLWPLSHCVWYSQTDSAAVK